MMNPLLAAWLLACFCRKDLSFSKESKKHSDDTERERLASHKCENLVELWGDGCCVTIFLHSRTVLWANLFGESNKCLLMSGTSHLTWNHLLPKSPAWMSKKWNKGVQIWENKCLCLLCCTSIWVNLNSVCVFISNSCSLSLQEGLQRLQAWPTRETPVNWPETWQVGGAKTN